MLAGDDDEDREAFAHALRGSRLHTSPWCTEENKPYPAHGIRRYQALLACHRKDWELAQSVLGQLRRLGAEQERHPLMAVVEAAAHMEVAGLMWASDPRAARKLLDVDKADRKGAKQMLASVRSRVQGYPKIKRWVDDAVVVVDKALSGKANDAPGALVRCPRLVGY